MSDPNHPFPLGLALHELSRLFRRKFEAQARQLGFTEGQWRTLWTLSRKQGISQARLADFLEMQPISLVRVLDRLESAGLIERRPDPNDRRAVQLYPTAAADPILNQLRGYAEELQANLIREMSAGEIEQCVTTLDRVRQVLETQATKARAG
jgi:DNA-binding MarR family transcriptional regulator